MRDKLIGAASIAAGLMALLFMLAIVFPALLVWALIERTRMNAEAEFDETGKPILPEIDRARKAHEEGWRW